MALKPLPLKQVLDLEYKIETENCKAILLFKHKEDWLKKYNFESMKKRIKHILIVLIVLLFSSCEILVDAVTDESVETLTHTIDYPIASLILKKDMDLEIIESEDNQIVIEGAKAIIENFSFYVDTGNVTLHYDKYGSWMYDKPKVQLRIPKICRIELYADNALYAPQTLHTENIDIFSDGTNDIMLEVDCKKLSIFGNYVANFYISGNAERIDVTTTHGSIFYGAGLAADSVICNLNGSNNQIVNPLELLKCNLNYSGNIYYVHEPDELIIERTENGKGQVVFDASLR